MNTNLKNIAWAAALASFGFAACQDILDEEPRSNFEPGYFKTTEGINGGLTGLYQNLRNMYGNMYFYNSLETGTDEYTYAQSADNNFKDHDLSGAGTLTPSSSRSDAMWGQAYTAINSACAIIENGEESNMSAALLAEAYFFRGFHFFNLVQTFGGVPLDLGSGELHSNQSPSRVSVRNTVPEVYSAVFADLNKAVNDLPVAARKTGTVTKNVARLFLAKAYLTFGWWLENPKNIPTYPECSRTDKDGHDAAWYFSKAYEVAKTAIDDPGIYGLMSHYYDVNLGANDRNKECMFYADRIEGDEFYNQASLSWSNGGGAENFAMWAVTWNYEGTFKSQGKKTMHREASQWAGRPWTRMAPTHEALAMFDDKVKDSRWDGTFVTVYRGNWDKGGDKTATYKNANDMDVAPGEPLLTFLTDDPSDVVYPVSKADNEATSNVGAGTMAGRADFVFGTGHTSRYAYPGLWKLGTYRTDNGGGLGQPNGASTRPFVIAKFSELYLIAAEAAVKKGDNAAAKDMLNVLRARAGKWTFSNAENKAVSVDYSADLVAATPATITIDYVLDERARELFGEGLRWYDLVRTQTWAERAGKYTIAEANSDGVWTEVKSTTRTITPELYLRPIPTGQLNALEMTEDEVKAYQNPGYK